MKVSQGRKSYPKQTVARIRQMDYNIIMMSGGEEWEAMLIC